MPSVVSDKHHLLHPLGSLNVLRIIVGDGVSRYMSRTEDKGVCGVCNGSMFYSYTWDWHVTLH